jgi:assimilatory nitrate reductase catalytic subunit
MGERLESCLYISDRAAMQGRESLANLFAVDKLTQVQRSALLTGGAVTEDVGPIVCSCFGVGRETLRRVIKEQRFSQAQQVGSCLRAGTNCGSCLPEIQVLLADATQGDAADRAMVTEAGTLPNRIPVSTSTALPLFT